MEILCRAVFVPLAVVLLVLAFHDGARARVLNLRGIVRRGRRRPRAPWLRRWAR